MKPHDIGQQRVLLLLAFIVFGSSTFAAANCFKLESTVLYQPDEPLQSRLSSAEELVLYIKRLDATCAAFFASERTPESLDVVVGLKPEKKVRVWFISSRRTSHDKSLIALRRKLEAVPRCAVHNGPVGFALRCTIAGGGPAGKTTGGFQPPMPKEWRDAAGGKSVLIPDGIFERIWPD